MKQKEIISQLSDKLKQEPHLLIWGFLALLKGYYYKIKYFFSFKKVKIGKFFRVYGKLNIVCHGKLTIGDNVYIDSFTIKPVCLSAFTKKSHIILKDSSAFNGTSIQCYDKIEVRENSNIANAYITDNSGHSLDVDRREKFRKDVKMNPVIIDKNVWISVNSVILHGVKIGENSVIGACSLVTKDVPKNVFAAGNPLKILKKIK